MSSLRGKTAKALAAALAALFLLYASAADASAQCALCRSGLEKTGEATAKALNLGILVLLVPPVAIFCTIFAVAVRHGKEDGGEEQRD